MLGGMFNMFGQQQANDVNMEAVQEYNRGQMELAKYQNQFNLEQWNRQNVYNSPEAQMLRYKDAGLNENLIYGQGSNGNASGHVTAATPQMAAPPRQENVLGSFGTADFINAMSIASQIDKNEKEGNYIEARTRLTDSEKDLNQLKQIHQQIENAKSSEERDVWRKMLRLKMDDIETRVLGISEQTRGAKLRNDVFSTYGDRQAAAELGLTESRINLTDASTSKTFSDIILNQYRQREINAHITQMLASANLSNAQADRIGKLISYEIEQYKANTSKTWRDSAVSHNKAINYSLENKIKDILIKNGVDLKSIGANGGMNLHNFFNGVNNALKGTSFQMF